MKPSFTRFKYYWGERVISKHIKKESNRTMRSCNIEDARSVGMLCEIKKKEDYHALVEIIDFLKKEYSIKNLKILAFYPFKDEPFFLKSRLGLDFFSLNELNYYGFPNNSVVRNFMNESFDILIDLTQRRIVPLRLVLLFSKSSFKVGSFSDEKKPFYDLMIETDPSDYKEYVTQVTSYLKIFDKNG